MGLTRAPASDRRLCPLGSVGRHDLHGAPPLARGLVGEQVGHPLAASLVGPYEAAAVVVDDDGEALAAPLAGGPVDADAPHAVEPAASVGGPQVGAGASADVSHGVPLDARRTAGAATWASVTRRGIRTCYRKQGTAARAPSVA